jgi:hypothetical protein
VSGESILEPGAELETVCPDCKGRGGYNQRNYWCNCLLCGGAGHRLTVLGEKVIAVVRHHLDNREMMQRTNEGT